MQTSMNLHNMQVRLHKVDIMFRGSSRMPVNLRMVKFYYFSQHDKIAQQVPGTLHPTKSEANKLSISHLELIMIAVGVLQPVCT